jgi:hypothetical protein
MLVAILDSPVAKQVRYPGPSRSVHAGKDREVYVHDRARTNLLFVFHIGHALILQQYYTIWNGTEVPILGKAKSEGLAAWSCGDQQARP